MTADRIIIRFRGKVDADGHRTEHATVWPNYVDATTPGFTVTPRGNGYMADVTIELDAKNIRQRS